MRVSVTALEIAGQFAVRGEVASMEALPGGHINRSFEVETRGPRGNSTYLLQRLNPAVFPDGAAVMDNIGAVTRFLERRLRETPGTPWKTLTLVSTLDDRDWYRAPDGACWRMFVFLPRTQVHLRCDAPDQAREAARAFGAFIRLLADYDGPPLAETIPGFHDTAARFLALEDAAARDPARRAGDAAAELEALAQRRGLAGVLPPLMMRGEIPRRIVHNDAKISNVLFDAASGRAICVIDLDTVMPGSALHDFGDLVRSMVTGTEEDEPDRARIRVRFDIFEALVEGFLAEAGGVLTAAERSHLVFGARLITLEQAVRFLTDHLEGDRYYKVNREGQNLVRCRTQLGLLEELEAAEGRLQAVVDQQGTG
ncbi:MAG: phosphotransferase enzyme family protein [Gemmatimonadales bacterium]